MNLRAGILISELKRELRFQAVELGLTYSQDSRWSAVKSIKMPSRQASTDASTPATAPDSTSPTETADGTQTTDTPPSEQPDSGN